MSLLIPYFFNGNILCATGLKSDVSFAATTTNDEDPVKCDKGK